VGHQELIRLVMKRAKEIGGISLIVTFRPHPLKILAPEKCPPLISIYEEKIKHIEKLGVDVLVKIPFTKDFASMTPRDFVKNILFDLLGAKEIFVGYNYRFGKGREGNIQMLRELGDELGFSLREVEQVSLDGEVISSTKIRDLIKEGQVEHASRQLGRHYAITGIVVKGDRRGKSIGFPTANIAPKHSIHPAYGVYVVRIVAREKCYDGVANVGLRPTFDKKDLTLEVHILDFNEDLYGEEVTVCFLHRVRAEKKFESVEALVQQIKSDIKTVKVFLANRSANKIDCECKQ
jgi:riboflavin kinase/FMN adenylyltransferase